MRKFVIFPAVALGVVLISGSAGVSLYAQEAVPEGFKKGELSPLPSAEMIEAGKRVYSPSASGAMASKDPGMARLPIDSGRGPEISIRGRSRFVIPPAANCPCSTPESPRPVRMTYSRPSPTACLDLPCRHGMVFSPTNSVYKFCHS